MYKFFIIVLLLVGSSVRAEGDWFESFKKTATDKDLYHFLYAMPKGGDLHNHLSGAGFPEWWLELALAQEKRGYIYYTKVKINNCAGYGGNEFGGNPYLLYFKNIQESTYKKLSACERSEYVRLQDMSAEQKAGWLNSLKLDSAHEGRDEFFQTHWQRLNELYMNHYVLAEILVRNMQAFGREGLMYLEIDCSPVGMRPDGSLIDAEEVYRYYKERLQQKDAVESGVTVKFQYALLRFAPNAEERLAQMYAFVDAHRDMYVAIDMVGREDNDKGHPLRFLPTLRKLRAQYPGIDLSIHAGEVDEPNKHIRNTLLLGANRIGHGVNLLTDPDTYLLMRHSNYMVEVNLISNLLLEYVDDYSKHPFPELLRTDVPVALSTDDRGMWDSNLTDEFFVAVKEFNLSWSELQTLGLNSLKYGFMNDELKTKLVHDYQKKMDKFAQQFQKGSQRVLSSKPPMRGFICNHYELCSTP